MRRKKAPRIDVATLQPTELGELKKVVQEFIERIRNVDNELEELKQSRKEIIEEYSEKLDVKTLQTALKVLDIESKVEFKGNYDSFIEVLKKLDGYVDAPEGSNE